MRTNFEIVHLDHVEPFVRSTKGNNYILGTVDNLTKYVKLYPVKSCGVETVLKSLKNCIQFFREPKILVTDLGTTFTSKSFEDFNQQLGIYHSSISVRHP